MNVLFDLLKSKFEDNNIATEVILPRVKLLDQYSKQSPAFNDPKYLPFYYRLGEQLKPKKAIQIGSNLGLIAASFLKSCKTVNEWTFIDQHSQFTNIIRSNIRTCSECKLNFFNVEKDKIIDEKKNLNYNDICFISEDFVEKDFQVYLDYSWKFLKNEGFLVVDQIYQKQKKEKFLEFCDIKNREPTLFNTRYSIGIVQK